MSNFSYTVNAENGGTNTADATIQVERNRNQKLDLVEQADTNSRDDVFAVDDFTLTESNGIDALTDNEVNSLVDEIDEKGLVGSGPSDNSPETDSG